MEEGGEEKGGGGDERREAYGTRTKARAQWRTVGGDIQGHHRDPHQCQAINFEGGSSQGT